MNAYSNCYNLRHLLIHTRLAIFFTIFIIFSSISPSWAAFPIHLNSKTFSYCKQNTTYSIPKREKNCQQSFINCFKEKYFGFYGNYNEKSGILGILSFVLAILSLAALIAAGLTLFYALPTNFVSIFAMKIPPEMYLYFGISVFCSLGAMVLGFLGIKRKNAGFAIVGFILGAILLLAGVTILSNI